MGKVLGKARLKLVSILYCDKLFFALLEGRIGSLLIREQLGIGMVGLL